MDTQQAQQTGKMQMEFKQATLADVPNFGGRQRWALYRIKDTAGFYTLGGVPVLFLFDKADPRAIAPETILQPTAPVVYYELQMSGFPDQG